MDLNGQIVSLCLPRIIAEYDFDCVTHRRVIVGAKSWHLLRLSMIQSFGDVLVRSIAKATGLTMNAVKHYADPKKIEEVMLFRFVTGNGQVVEVTETDNLEDNMTIVLEVIKRSNGAEMPEGPYRIWCPVHSEGQGYLSLGESSIGAASFAIVSNGTAESPTRMYLEKVQDADFYYLRIHHFENTYYVRCIGTEAIAKQAGNGPIDSEASVFSVVKQITGNYFYFQLEDRKTHKDNSNPSLLKIGTKNVMFVETVGNDPGTLQFYLDQSFLFAMCLDANHFKQVSKKRGKYGFANFYSL